MPKYEISVDIAPLAAALTVSGNEIAMLVSQAVALTASKVQERWVDEVMQAKSIWIGEKQEYASSILVRSINEFEAEVWSNYKHAAEIETGRPARDLKRMLDTSTKVRVSAKGARYLIIPFRHNTPGNSAHAQAMPPEVYAVAKGLRQSSVTGAGTRMSGLNAYNRTTRNPLVVPKNVYQWGEKLGAGHGVKIKESHHSDPYAGMVRMKTATGGSQYLTFRVMSEHSQGWIIPAKPGALLAQKATEEVRPLFRQAIEEAVMRGLPVDPRT